MMNSLRQKIFSNIILIGILILTNLCTSNIYAANLFGATCVKTIGFPTGDFLNNNSIFNYLYQHFDMKNHDNDHNKPDSISACAPIKIDNDGKGKIYFYLKTNKKIDDNCADAYSARGELVYSCKRVLNIGEPGSTIRDIGADSDQLRNNKLLQNLVVSAEIVGNAACLMISTPRGRAPFLCTKIMGKDQDDDFLKLTPLKTCSNVDSSCYDNSKQSQSLFNFSGVTVSCVKDTLKKTFFEKAECVHDDNSYTFTMLSPFADFQTYMRQAVFGALIIYVMIYGFKIALNVDYASLNQIMTFVMKMILVTYFSVGIVPLGKWGQEGSVPQNGIKEYVLPYALAATSSFADIVFSAGGNAVQFSNNKAGNKAVGLCEFDIKKYQKGYEYFHLWDAIDCRIAYYLGMDLVYGEGGLWQDGHVKATKDSVDSASVAAQDISINTKSDNVDANEIAGLKLPANFKFFNVMFGLLLSGNVLVVLSGVMFAIFLISVLLYFVTLYLVCMITIHVLAYIAPIFVPMALFNQTKEYFNAWLRILLSCTIQPAVVAGFIALLLTVYDTAIYGNCAFERENYKDLYISTAQEDENIHHARASIFKLKMPDDIKGDVHDPDTHITNCSHTLGYKLYRYYLGEGWQKTTFIIFQIITLKDSLDIASSLFYVLLFTILFYFFMKSISEFAMQITNGPNMASVTASPTMVVDKVAGAAQKAQQAAQVVQRLKQGKAGSGNQGGQGQKARSGISGSLNSKGSS